MNFFLSLTSHKAAHKSAQGFSLAYLGILSPAEPRCQVPRLTACRVVLYYYTVYCVPCRGPGLLAGLGLGWAAWAGWLVSDVSDICLGV